MSATHPKKVFKKRIRLNAETYKEWCRDALNTAFGWGPEAIRAVAKITTAHEIATRHWFGAKHGMRGDYLMNLMAADDRFCAEVLRAVGRHDLADAVDTRGALADVRRSLAKAQALLARHE